MKIKDEKIDIQNTKRNESSLCRSITSVFKYYVNLLSLASPSYERRKMYRVVFKTQA